MLSVQMCSSDHQPLRDLWRHPHRLLLCGAVVHLHISPGQVQQEVPPPQSPGDQHSQEQGQEVHSGDAAWGWVLVWQLGSVFHLCCLVRVRPSCISHSSVMHQSCINRASVMHQSSEVPVAAATECFACASLRLTNSCCAQSTCYDT